MNNRVPKIFLSHSSGDKLLALEIANQIENALNKLEYVFLSSRPDAIEPGDEWMTTVIDELDRSIALVILITQSSINSVWVGFELGYFWDKFKGRHIYPLIVPGVPIPSPLNRIQAKSVLSKKELLSFFDNLSIGVARKPRENIDIDMIVETASNLTKQPPALSLSRFEELLSLHDKWNRTQQSGMVYWTYEDDVRYQILLDRSSWNDEYHQGIEPGLRRANSEIREVVLRFNAQPVKQVYFVSSGQGETFLPATLLLSENRSSRYWTILDMKLANLIGNTGDPYLSADDYAKIHGIKILD